MLAYLTSMMDDKPQNDEQIKHSKVSTFHEMLCKTLINPEGLTCITDFKSIPLVATAKESTPQSLRHSIGNGCSFNKRQRIHQLAPKEEEWVIKIQIKLKFL